VQSQVARYKGRLIANRFVAFDQVLVCIRENRRGLADSEKEGTAAEEMALDSAVTMSGGRKPSRILRSCLLPPAHRRNGSVLGTPFDRDRLVFVTFFSRAAPNVFNFGCLLYARRNLSNLTTILSVSFEQWERGTVEILCAPGSLLMRARWEALLYSRGQRWGDEGPRGLDHGGGGWQSAEDLPPSGAPYLFGLGPRAHALG